MMFIQCLLVCHLLNKLIRNIRFTTCTISFTSTVSDKVTLLTTGQSQAEHVVEEGALRFTPVLNVFHDQVDRQVSGFCTDDSTISDISALVAAPAVSELAAVELSRVDGGGTKGAVATLPYCLYNCSLDACL